MSLGFQLRHLTHIHHVHMLVHMHIAWARCAHQASATCIILTIWLYLLGQRHVDQLRRSLPRLPAARPAARLGGEASLVAERASGGGERQLKK